jgi:hypothetical protein
VLGEVPGKQGADEAGGSVDDEVVLPGSHAAIIQAVTPPPGERRQG